MRNVLLWGSLLTATFAAIACGTSSSSTDDADAGVGDDGSIVLDPSTANTPPGAAGTGLATGLPCDVQAVLENRCLACHSGTSPPPLLTYDDLMKPSTVDPAKTLAQLALERMKSTTSPMPPPPAVPPDAEEIAAFEAWVNAGTPKGAACTTPPPIGDAGADGGADAGPLTCTSGKTWTKGDDGSELMHPGAACNACHQVQGGPNLRVAGTVYPTLHEPNDCNGAATPPPIVVTVTDSKNRTFDMPVNAAGNFLRDKGGLKPPYRAKVTSGGKTRAMVGTVTSGDCNSCHTPTGLNGAPGRIQAP
jgi:hypothetical protein